MQCPHASILKRGIKVRDTPTLPYKSLPFRQKNPEFLEESHSTKAWNVSMQCPDA